MEARRAVFEEAGERVVAAEEERRRVLAAAAFRLGVSAGDLDASLYADLWDEQVLADFDAPHQQELLKEYNFALTLALLTQARRMELTHRGMDEDLERLGRRLGGCRAHLASGVSKLTVEQRPSRRAGQRAVVLEGLLSRLLLKEGWRLRAEVPHTSRTGKIYILELSGESEGGLVTPSDLNRRMNVKATAGAEAIGRSLGEIVIVDELASELGVTGAEARQRLRRSGRRYVDLGDVLVVPEKLREMEQALAAAKDMRLSTVLGVLRRLGCRSPLPVLEALGYSVEWAGDREKSTVYRLRRRRTTP